MVRNMNVMPYKKKNQQLILNYYFSRYIVDKIISNLIVRGRGNFLRNKVYLLIKLYKTIYLNAYSLFHMLVNRLKQHFVVFIDGVKTKRKPYRLIRIYQYVNCIGRVQSYQKAYKNLRRGLLLRKESSLFNKLFNELYDTFKLKTTPSVLKKQLDYSILWHRLALKPVQQLIVKFVRYPSFLQNPKIRSVQKDLFIPVKTRNIKHNRVRSKKFFVNNKVNMSSIS